MAGGAEIVEWMIVYEDPETSHSTYDNLWAFTQEEARTDFEELMPEIERIIGVYVAPEVGCDEDYIGLAGPEPASGIVILLTPDLGISGNVIVDLEYSIETEGHRFLWSTRSTNPDTQDERPYVGDQLGWEDLPTDRSVRAADGQYLQIAEVNESFEVVKYGYIVVGSSSEGSE